jgi:hypothetical protein
MDHITQATVAANTPEADNFQAADYVASKEIKVRSIPQNGDDTSGRDLLIPKGTGVSLIETKVDPELGTLVRIGIDTDEENALPSDVWVPLDQALLEALVQVDSPEAQELIDAADPASLFVLVARRQMTYCYRHVKRYLLSTGQVKVYLPGVSAYMAAKILPRHGFRNTGRNPATARNGDVCVYAGGPKGHGHIEVKRNGKWWYGYGFKNRPIQNRKFLGCFAK